MNTKWKMRYSMNFEMPLFHGAYRNSIGIHGRNLPVYIGRSQLVNNTKKTPAMCCHLSLTFRWSNRAYRFARDVDIAVKDGCRKAVHYPTRFPLFYVHYVISKLLPANFQHRYADENGYNLDSLRMLYP